MDMNLLRCLACDFRTAMEIVSKQKLYGRLNVFSGFPRGCCTYTSDLLASYLMKNGISRDRIHVLRGASTATRDTHCWIMIDNMLFIDITADQYNINQAFQKYWPIPACCIVRQGTYLYSIFDEQTSDPQIGIEAYSEDMSEKLSVVYNAAIFQIEHRQQRR